MHENPCWTCQKACGGCSWSRSFSPVPGWTAEKTPRGGWHITACPEFVRG